MRTPIVPLHELLFHSDSSRSERQASEAALNGKRSGTCIKHRLNLGQEFVIGGYTPGPHGLDSIIVGYYRGNDLVYVARTRNGFVPASRRKALFEKLRPLVIS